MIDHTILKPGCTIAEVKQVCEEAMTHGFAAVCVPPYYVKDAVHMLGDSPVKVATVAGFPFGYAAIFAKMEEIKRSLEEGADEIDAVINLCAVKNGAWNYVRSEMEAFSTACHMKGKIVKIILETGMMTEPELVKLCEISKEIKVDFVKTSTGFNGEGATVEAVKFLRKHLPKSIKIKASGGIRERAFAEALVQAGAERIGTSSGVLIIQ